MKLTLLALLGAFLVTGCSHSLNDRRQTFRPVERQGAWSDYYTSVKKGEEPQAPKEKK
jgi:hypothetical protein